MPQGLNAFSLVWLVLGVGLKPFCRVLFVNSGMILSHEWPYIKCTDSFSHKKSIANLTAEPPPPQKEEKAPIFGGFFGGGGVSANIGVVQVC